MDQKYDKIEDLASDESFINYCFDTDERDVAYWEVWLAAHPDRVAFFKEAREWVFMMAVRPSPDEKEEEWEKLNRMRSPVAGSSPEVESSERGLWRSVVVVFVLGILLGGGGYFFLERGKNSKENIPVQQASVYSEAVFETGPGEQREVMLKDGTKIMLNADTRLKVETDLVHDSLREVSLEGETYFRVKHEVNRPFIVHTGDMNIRVLGTTFNVKAYGDDREAAATLIEGSIQVNLLDDSINTILLKPKEKITVSVGPESGKRSEIKSEKQVTPVKTLKKISVVAVQKDPLLDSSAFLATAWITGRLAFRDERFDDLARQMERRYGVEFSFRDEALRAYRFTGIFSKENLAEALEALKLTSPSAPFDYAIENKHVYIEKR